MVLGPRLGLRQSQSLVMTPQLQQAIKLLQMSNVELTDYIEQEIGQNPLLEREDADGGLEGAADMPSAETSVDSVDAASGAGDSDGADDPSFDDTDSVPDASDHATSESIGDDERALDIDYENVYEPESASDGAPAGGEREGEGLLWNTSGSGSGADQWAVPALAGMHTSSIVPTCRASLSAASCARPLTTKLSASVPAAIRYVSACSTCSW